MCRLLLRGCVGCCVGVQRCQERAATSNCSEISLGAGRVCREQEGALGVAWGAEGSYRFLAAQRMSGNRLERAVRVDSRGLEWPAPGLHTT